MLKRAALSLLLTFFVSTLLAWPLTFLGVWFLSGFGFFTVLQFVGFYFYRDYLTRKNAIEEQKLIIAREAELSKQGAEVVCPCDRQVKCFIPIVLNQRNEYICPGCDKNVNVAVNLKTVLVTTPIVDTLEDVVVNKLRSQSGNS